MTTVDKRNEPASTVRAYHATFEAFYRITAKHTFAIACRHLWGRGGRGQRSGSRKLSGNLAIWRSWEHRRSLPLEDNTKYLARIVYSKRSITTGKFASLTSSTKWFTLTAINLGLRTPP
jgi:hypothetical protein